MPKPTDTTKKINILYFFHLQITTPLGVVSGIKKRNKKGFIFYTSQSSTASVRPFTGSRVGINSCPTNALYLISSKAFIIGG